MNNWPKFLWQNRKVMWNFCRGNRIKFYYNMTRIQKPRWVLVLQQYFYLLMLRLGFIPFAFKYQYTYDTTSPFFLVYSLIEKNNMVILKEWEKQLTHLHSGETWEMTSKKWRNIQ